MYIIDGGNFFILFFLLHLGNILEWGYSFGEHAKGFRIHLLLIKYLGVSKTLKLPDA